MSLINEALKKAQRQRSEGQPGEIPAVFTASPLNTAIGTPGPRIVKRAAPMPARTLMILLAGGTAVLAMACVLAFLFFWPEPVEESAPARPTAAAGAKPGGTSLPTTGTATGSPLINSPDGTVATTSSDPLAPTISITLPPPATPVVETPEPESEPAVTPIKKPTVIARLQTLIEEFKITGIRASETDPKVIMNDRVVRLNDVVDRFSGLRLTRIEAHRLIFTDSHGTEYIKEF